MTTKFKYSDYYQDCEFSNKKNLVLPLFYRNQFIHFDKEIRHNKQFKLVQNIIRLRNFQENKCFLIQKDKIGTPKIVAKQLGLKSPNKNQLDWPIIDLDECSYIVCQFNENQFVNIVKESRSIFNEKSKSNRVTYYLVHMYTQSKNQKNQIQNIRIRNDPKQSKNKRQKVIKSDSEIVIESNSESCSEEENDQSEEQNLGNKSEDEFQEDNQEEVRSSEKKDKNLSSIKQYILSLPKIEIIKKFQAMYKEKSEANKQQQIQINSLLKENERLKEKNKKQDNILDDNDQQFELNFSQYQHFS